MHTNHELHFVLDQPKGIYVIDQKAKESKNLIILPVLSSSYPKQTCGTDQKATK
jgi:hypothetical protein